MYLKTTGRWLYPFSVFLLDLYWHGFLKINLWWAVYPPYPYPPCVRTSNSSIERLCLLDHFIWIQAFPESTKCFFCKVGLLCTLNIHYFVAQTFDALNYANIWRFETIVTKLDENNELVASLSKSK